MDQITFIGEHLLIGNIGHFCAITSMVAALLASIAYFISNNKENPEEKLSWKNLGRVCFTLHGFSVIGIIATLFLMIWNNYFEYHYVFSHSSTELPVHYIVSCFWEGQEGSFLLWTFWHVILGLFTISTSGKWESPVMSVISITQVFLAAMLIGIYFFGYKIGSSPFILMRDFMPANPAFLNPNYLEGVDGNGLNPLLQNYWMVIHPPVLFLGFAATIMPFAYTIAGLWNGDFSKSWVYPTLRWSLFSSVFLGVGILMGGAWAYESLSFGGYWAWDPVENASLVPWIISICGFHTLLAYKHSGHALRATSIFYILTFILILYSTFLTRSGILGDTSVHAFVDLGMSGQLIVFLVSFMLLAFVLLIVKWNKMPHPEKEEPTYSREFWLFVGSLTMFLVSLLIAVDTSWPVVNKIFNTERVIVDPVSHYNRYSIWFGIAVLLLAVTTQFMRYKGNNFKMLSKAAFSFIAALLLAFGISYYANYGIFEKTNFFNAFEMPFLSPYFLLLFAALYAIIGNAAYIFQVLKGKIKVAGSAVAHIGFGLMLLGVLISSSKKEVISKNNIGVDFGSGFSQEEKMNNILLVRNQPVQMGDYWLTYKDSRVDLHDTYYEIEYHKKEKMDDKNPTEVFNLYPYAQVNPKMGLVSNPDTKHYWTKDIFTFVSSVPDNTDTSDKEQSFEEFTLSVGDTVSTGSSLIVLNKLNPNPVHPDYLATPNDIAVGAQMTVMTLSNKVDVEPVYYIRGNIENKIPDVIEELGITVNFDKVLPNESKVTISVLEDAAKTDFIILKAIVFPGINVLWLGCIVMAIGFFMSIIQRYREGKRLKKSANYNS